MGSGSGRTATNNYLFDTELLGGADLRDIRKWHGSEFSLYMGWTLKSGSQLKCHGGCVKVICEVFQVNDNILFFFLFTGFIRVKAASIDTVKVNTNSFFIKTSFIV